MLEPCDLRRLESRETKLGLTPQDKSQWLMHDHQNDPRYIFDERLNSIEITLAEHEEYFKTIESILTKIQAVYEAIRDGRHPC